MSCLVDFVVIDASVWKLCMSVRVGGAEKPLTLFFV